MICTWLKKTSGYHCHHLYLLMQQNPEWFDNVISAHQICHEMSGSLSILYYAFCLSWAIVARGLTKAGLFPSVLWQHWLGDRKGIQPVKRWVFVCCWWWFDWSFAHLIASVVTSTSVILPPPPPSSFAPISCRMERFWDWRTQVVLEVTYWRTQVVLEVTFETRVVCFLSVCIAAAVAPCGLRGCKNWPAPFPGRMSYKVTKPGLALSVVYLSMLYCIVVY